MEIIWAILGFLSFWSYPVIIIALPILCVIICNRMSPSAAEQQQYNDKCIYDAVERHKERLEK